MEQIPATMRAQVLVEPKRLDLQERPVPEPGAGEVLLRVRSVGVCGSDVHYFLDGRIGDFVVDKPLVLGHEMSGVIVAVGTGVDESRIGERVAVDPQRPCRLCEQCKTGHLNLCPKMQFLATPPIDGAFVDYLTAPADFCYAVPEGMSNNVAALMEPFSVGYWAAGKGRITPGSTVFVSGAGPIGAFSAMAARAFGATEVIVTDLVELRRSRILNYGATSSLDPTASDFDPGSIQAQAFIECSGAAPALVSGLSTLRPAGTAVMVGLGAEQVGLPVQLIMNREIELTGIFRYVNTWPTVITLGMTNGYDLDSMVTGEYALEDAEAALLSDSEPSTMKSVVVVSREDS